MPQLPPEPVLSDAGQAAVRQIVHPLFAEIGEPITDVASHRGLQQLPLEPPRSAAASDTAAWLCDTAAALVGVLGSAVLDRNTFQKHIVLRLPSEALPAGAGDLILAGLSLGFCLAAEEQPPRFELSGGEESAKAELLEAWRRWQGAAATPAALEEVERRPPADFEWLRADATGESRVLRLAVAASTLRHGYRLLRRRHGEVAKAPSVSGTQLVEDDALADRSTATERISLEFEPGPRDAQLDLAAALTDKGNQVAVMSAASADTVAGNFLSGGPHQLEASVCMQSTLFFSLQKGARLARKRNAMDSVGRPVHVPEAGAIVSPDVHIFRHGVDRGYAPSPPSTLAAVVSISLPNSGSSGPIDCPEDESPEAREHLLEQKFQAVLWGSTRVGANIAVIPEIGCSDPFTTPEAVGGALARALPRFHGAIERVVVTGRSCFFEAVRAEYERQLQKRPADPLAALRLAPTDRDLEEDQDALQALASAKEHTTVVAPKAEEQTTVRALTSAKEHTTVVAAPKAGVVAPVTGPHQKAEVPPGAAPPTRLDLLELALAAKEQAARVASDTDCSVLVPAPMAEAPATRLDLLNPALAASRAAPPTRLDLLMLRLPEAHHHLPLAGSTASASMPRVPPPPPPPSVPPPPPPPWPHGTCEPRTRLDLATVPPALASGMALATAASDNSPKPDSCGAFAANPSRAESARQLGIELQSRAALLREQFQRFERLLHKCGVQKTEPLPPSRLEHLLSECVSSASGGSCGIMTTWTSGKRRPRVDELQFLTHMRDLRRERRPISQPELFVLVNAWELYEAYREDIDLLFNLYDSDGAGALKEPEAAHVLQEMSGGTLTEAGVAAIMRKPDFKPPGSISRTEFAIMVAKWQALPPMKVTMSPVAKGPMATLPATKEPVAPVAKVPMTMPDVGKAPLAGLPAHRQGKWNANCSVQ